MKRITPAVKLIGYALWRKYKYFKKKEMLDKDGSFFYDDERLSREEAVSIRTINRVRKYLQNYLGFIKYKPGKYRKHFTKYWIVGKPDKLSPFWQQITPDKKSKRDDKMSSNTCQNVTPNKEINNRNNILDDYQRGKMHKKCQEFLKDLSNKAKRSTDETSNPG
jgi:hypothetical protein